MRRYRCTKAGKRKALRELSSKTVGSITAVGNDSNPHESLIDNCSGALRLVLGSVILPTAVDASGQELVVAGQASVARRLGRACALTL